MTKQVIDLEDEDHQQYECDDQRKHTEASFPSGRARDDLFHAAGGSPHPHVRYVDVVLQVV